MESEKKLSVIGLGFAKFGDVKFYIVGHPILYFPS